MSSCLDQRPRRPVRDSLRPAKFPRQACGLDHGELTRYRLSLNHPRRAARSGLAERIQYGIRYLRKPLKRYRRERSLSTERMDGFRSTRGIGGRAPRPWGITKLGRILMMQNQYTAVVKQEGDWWIGWIEEVPGVNCQERTHDELIETLRVTLREALDLNKQDALAAASEGYREEPIGL